MARDLSENERACLDRVLQSDFPGAEAFRVQALSARVSDDSTWALDLVVEPGAPRSSNHASRPVEAAVQPTGHHAAGGLIAWADAGLLTGLEYWWTDDERPKSFPNVDRVTGIG